jgi:protein-tyrosine phosphatase
MTEAVEPGPTGFCNLRPVPGVRDGLVLRCDVPRWLTAEELAALGPIATQLDLRATEEADLDGSGLLADHGVIRHHLPYGDRAKPVTSDEVIDDIIGQYRVFTAMGVGTVVAGFELLTQVDLPAIVHCTAGKDRTGVFVAALSLAMGVPTEAVLADFMASETAQIEMERRFWLLPSTAARTNPVPPGAYPISMALGEAVLDVIERSGGVEAWLAEGDAAPDLIDRLRARLA